MRSDPDVVVVGAGAAGLAAARELARREKRVLVLEARDRLFGRVDTLHDPSWSRPVERGAELVHHAAPLTEALARHSRVALVTVPDVHAWVEHGRARPTPDMEEAVRRVASRSARRGRDVSLAAVMEQAPASARRQVEAARFYVEGYHAAEIEKAGAAAFADAGGADEDAPAQRRAVDGYDMLLAALPRELPSDQVEVRTETIVTRIGWRRGHVRVGCSTRDGRLFENVDARACIVTVPVGVLKAGSLHFDPVPEGWTEALARIEMGVVDKLVLRFREAFWTDPGLWRRLGRRSRPPTFWHARGAAFPTFWTSAPQDDPILTAWAGGPAAHALAGGDEGVRIERAVASLSEMLGVPHAAVAEHVVASLHHDWLADPFSLGAYSYLGVGGLPAQRALARPVEATVVLAGEAFGDRSGTVEAALASGVRAARALLRSWNPQSSRGSSIGRRSTRSGVRRSGTLPRRSRRSRRT